MAEYNLKNGKKVIIRSASVSDAEAMVNLIKRADTESRFLAREPGEFQMTVAQEEDFIQQMLADNHNMWFMAEYEGKLVGQSFVGLVHKNLRYRHRAQVAFLLLKEYWNLGIGGKLMEECIGWCREHKIEQIELDVVAENERAMQMYQSFGFEITGKQPRALKYGDGTYADEFYMVNFLNDER